MLGVKPSITHEIYYGTDALMVSQVFMQLSRISSRLRLMNVEIFFMLSFQYLVGFKDNLRLTLDIYIKDKPFNGRNLL